jgi:lysophospholipase L1-like esterase
MKHILIFLFCSFWLTVSFSQQEQKLFPHTKIVFFGDSHTAYGYGAKDNSVQYQNHGYVAWVNALCPDVQIPKGGVLGVPGETTVQMVNRLQPIQSLGAKILVVLAGTNDALMAVNTETTKANLRKIYNTGLAAGMKVIAVTVLPQFTAIAYRNIVDSFRQRVNAWIRTQTDVTVIDAENELKDSTLYEDGVHLTATGALILAKKVAAPVNAWMAHCLPDSGNAAQLSFAGNANPLLMGTNGTKHGASGTVATKWDLAGAFAGNANVSGAKETDAAGYETQVITISGTYTGSSKRVTFTNEAAAPISLQTGDTVEGIVEMEIPSPMVGIKSIYLDVSAKDANYNVLAEGNSMFNTSTQPVAMPAGRYMLRTPPMTVGAGTVAHLTTQIFVEFINTTTVDPVSAIFKINSAGIRRLPLNDGPLAGINPSDQQFVCPGQPVLLQATDHAGYSYQWLANDTVLSGQIAAVLSVTKPGSYSVKVSSAGCSVLSDPVIVSDCTLRTTPNKWTGAVSDAWENPDNWSLHELPDSNTDVVIESGNVVVNSDAVCRTLTNHTGTNVTLKPGGTLRVLH